MEESCSASTLALELCQATGSSCVNSICQCAPGFRATTFVIDYSGFQCPDHVIHVVGVFAACGVVYILSAVALFAFLVVPSFQLHRQYKDSKVADIFLKEGLARCAF